jgi:hypothetical protein
LDPALLHSTRLLGLEDASRALFEYLSTERQTGAAHQMLDGSCRFRHDD